MVENKKQAITAAVIAVIAAYLVFAIFFVRTGVTSPLLFPGIFLYSYYFDSAFYIPLYLLVCTFFLLKKNFNRNNIILLVLTILPFITISLVLRLMYVETNLSALERGLLNSFGLFAPFILFLLALAQLLLIVRLGLFLHSKRKIKDIIAENMEEDSEDSFRDNAVENCEAAQPHNPDDIDKLSSARTGFVDLNFSYSPAEYAAPDPFGQDPPQADELFQPCEPEGSGNKKSNVDSRLQTIDGIPDYIDEVYTRPAYFRMEKKPEGEKDFSGLPETSAALESNADNDTFLIPDPDLAGVDMDPGEEGETEDDENEDEDSLGEGTDKNIVEVITLSDDNPVVVKEYFASQKKINLKKISYKIPVDILDEYEETGFVVIDERTKEESRILRQTLAEFKIEAEVTGIKKGPVITMFEILPAPGVKLSKITNLADNIALRLAASRVRIVAPIPGKHAVGIEVPNRTRAIVSFRELISVDYPQYSKYHLPVILGKDITGGEQVIDLTQTPHLLIAGATGSGKSVCVNSIIVSLLYNKKPQEVRLILIDPKIVELKLYNDIPHLLTPVITDSKKAFQALQYCIYEMEKRYALLDALGVRDIHSFNKKIKNNKIATMPLPYIVVVVDEFADLMATTGKELESTVARLAAMSRAVGIHLVLATQRPSIDVITGLIKANIPSRIAFMVASKTDSRIIIDSVGAEMLLGKGDMLFSSSWNPYLTRIQGAYLSENEAERVAEKVKEYGAPEYIDDEIFMDDEDDDGFELNGSDYGEDPLMDKAVEIVTTAGKASASYLQRRLKIGYNRAARLVEEMERRGIVGPQNGSKPRDILRKD